MRGRKRLRKKLWKKYVEPEIDKVRERLAVFCQEWFLDQLRRP